MWSFLFLHVVKVIRKANFILDLKKSSFNPESSKQDLSDKLVVGLERISEAFRVLLWEQAKEEGLSPIQIQLLIFLRYHKEEFRNVTYLAAEFNVTKPTLSDAVKALFQKKLIEKHPGLHDARSYSISLTQAGTNLAEKMEVFADPIKKHLSQMSTSGQQVMFKEITRLIYDLNRDGIITIQRTCFGCRFYEKKKKDHYCHFIKDDLTDGQIRLDCSDFVQANS